MIPTISRTIVLQPYEVRPVAVSGKVFSCSLATAPFLMSVDGQGFIDMQQGWTMDIRPDAFKSLIFQNPMGVAITVGYYAGASAMFYSPPTTLAEVTDAATYLKGGGIAAVPAGAAAVYNGQDGGHRRKQIMVTNLDAAAAIYLADADGKYLLPILAGESKTLALSGVCKLSNPNGADVSAVVGEVFYV